MAKAATAAAPKKKAAKKPVAKKKAQPVTGERQAWERGESIKCAPNQ